MKLTIPIILLTIFGLPMLAFNLYAIGSWEKFSGALEGVDPNAEDMGPPDVLGAIGVGFYDFVGDRREKGEMHAIFDVDRPTRLRFIHVSRRYSVEDVLQPGEAMPEPSLHETYVLARAPGLVMAECPSILKQLAKACAVSTVEVEPKKDGRFLAELRIGYLPANPAGDLSKIGQSTLVERVLRIDEYSSGLFKESDLPLIRSNIYATAQKTCDVLRARVGTCVVKRVNIDQRLKTEPTTTREAGYTVTASFQVSHLKNADTAPLLAGITNRDINKALSGIEVAGLPAIEVPTAEGESKSGGVLGFLDGLRGGGDADGLPQGEAPTVINGGNAFGGRGGGKTLTVGGN